MTYMQCFEQAAIQLGHTPHEAQLRVKALKAMGVPLPGNHGEIVPEEIQAYIVSRFVELMLRSQHQAATDPDYIPKAMKQVDDHNRKQTPLN